MDYNGIIDYDEFITGWKAWAVAQPHVPLANHTARTLLEIAADVDAKVCTRMLACTHTCTCTHTCMQAPSNACVGIHMNPYTYA